MNQSDFMPHDQGQILGSELSLMTEKTPPSYGEVPGFVMARIRGKDSLAEPPANVSMSSQTGAPSTVRVCLEKKFNSTSGTPRQQDIQSSALSNFTTIFQQSLETQEEGTCPQMQKWMKPDRTNPEMSGPYIGYYNRVTNMCGQVIGHISHVEPNTHQGMIIPMDFPLNVQPERVLGQPHLASGNNQAESKMTSASVPKKHGIAHCAKATRAAKVAPVLAGQSGSRAKKRAQRFVPLIQRRENHNSRERERRRQIRLCCDELNMLVPFCQTDTDKVSTLQWTTAYLRYINKMYGDALKEEFEKSLKDKNGKPNPSSGLDQTHQDMDENLDIPLAVEQ